MNSPHPFDHLRVDHIVHDVISRGSRLVRIHRKNIAPLAAGDGPSRFSDPLEPASLARRFLPIYLADKFLTSFGETIVRDRRDHQEDDPVVLAELVDREVSTIEVKDLTLLSLQGDAPTRMGIPTDAVRASKDLKGRALSETVWTKFPLIHGLSYPSRMTTERCVMIFDREVGRLSVVDTVPLMRHPLLGPALDRYRLPLKF